MLRFLIIIVILVLNPFVSLYVFPESIDTVEIAPGFPDNDYQKFKSNFTIANELIEKEPQSALYYVNRLLILANRLQDEKIMAQANYMYARVLLQNDDYENSLYHFLKSLKLFEQVADTQYIANCLNHLGIIYEYNNDLESARISYLNSYNYFKLINDSNNIPVIIRNLASINCKIGQLDSAFAFYKWAEYLFNQQKKPDEVKRVYIGIGETYLSMNEFSKALASFHKADSLQSNFNISEKGSLYNNLSKCYLKMNQLNEALLWADKAIELSKNEDAKKVLMESYRIRSTIDSSRGNYKSALSNLNKYLHIRQLLNSSEKQKKMAQIQGIYQTESKQREIEQLRNDKIRNEKLITLQKRLTYMFVFLVLLAIVSAMFIYRNHRIREKMYLDIVDKNRKLLQSQKQLEESNAIRDKFFGIVALDLKNPFVNLIGVADYLNEKFESIPPDKRRLMIVSLKDNAVKGYKLLENLHLWSKSQLGQINVNIKRNSLTELVRNEIEEIQDFLKRKEQSLISYLDDDFILFFDYELIKVAIWHILHNAVKYTHIQGRITVRITRSIDWVVVSVIDTGIGIPREFTENLLSIEGRFTAKGTNYEEGTGLGLLIAKDYVEKNKGKLEFVSEEGVGSNFYISLPAPQESLGK